MDWFDFPEEKRSNIESETLMLFMQDGWSTIITVHSGCICVVLCYKN